MSLQLQVDASLKPFNSFGVDVRARLFAEALAVQLDLTGVTAAEVMDAQRAIETLAAELAAEHATAADHARLRRLLSEAESLIDDGDAYTRISVSCDGGSSWLDIGAGPDSCPTPDYLFPGQVPRPKLQIATTTGDVKTKDM